MSGTPALSPGAVIRIFRRYGFGSDRIGGSHQIFKNRATGKMTVAPMYKGDLPKGTLLAIIQQAEIDTEELH